ncbi:MAG: YggS family pyridoxal phosphate-dependent enzyme [Gammaproteobacteria bacterium]|nr:YggS family pyridoxal phosphate-dependent enzyme [Gammaproteobacteria bacterium]
MDIAQRLLKVNQRIQQAEKASNRAAGSVQLLAVSKTKPVEDLLAAIAAEQTRFGENYLQEALEKISALKGQPLEWHFIGPIQSNKTRPIAENFTWVHSVDRLKIAQRLNDQRPQHLPPLNICLQVNVDNEASKSGFNLDELSQVAKEIAALPRLNLRGLMCIPATRSEFEQQRKPFAQLRQAMEQLQQQGLKLDTLSMGMSGDLEAAVAEGATFVRIGTDIFGARNYPTS